MMNCQAISPSAIQDGNTLQSVAQKQIWIIKENTAKSTFEGGGGRAKYKEYFSTYISGINHS